MLRDFGNWVGSSETSQMRQECGGFVTTLNSPTVTNYWMTAAVR